MSDLRAIMESSGLAEAEWPVIFDGDECRIYHGGAWNVEIPVPEQVAADLCAGALRRAIRAAVSDRASIKTYCINRWCAECAGTWSGEGPDEPAALAALLVKVRGGKGGGVTKLEFIKAVKDFAPSTTLAQARDIAEALELRNVTDGLIYGIMYDRRAHPTTDPRSAARGTERKS